jgi:hypothetical protein
MYESLVDFDRNLFLALNSMHSPVMDSIMWWVTDKFIWIPFYAFLAYFLWKKFGNQAVFMVLFAAVLVTLSDQGSVLLKNCSKENDPVMMSTSPCWFTPSTINAEENSVRFIACSQYHGCIYLSVITDTIFYQQKRYHFHRILGGNRRVFQNLSGRTFPC